MTGTVRTFDRRGAMPAHVILLRGTLIQYPIVGQAVSQRVPFMPVSGVSDTFALCR